MPITILQIILSTKIRYSHLNGSLWSFLRQKVIFKTFIVPLCHFTCTKNQGPVTGWRQVATCLMAAILPPRHSWAGEVGLRGTELSCNSCPVYFSLSIAPKRPSCLPRVDTPTVTAKDPVGAAYLDITVLHMKAVLLWNFYCFFFLTTTQ